MGSSERLGILGGGTIACGLAAVAARGPVILRARSEESAEQARATIDRHCAKLPDSDPENVHIVTDLAELVDATFVVEAIAESFNAKAGLMHALGDQVSDDTVIASTTSSLSVRQLAAASRRQERFCGLHVFNPVTRMPLVELIFPSHASDDTRARARAVCVYLGKTPVEVPDQPGFVVNRLLFPFLFDAVRLLERTGMSAADVDECMKLGPATRWGRSRCSTSSASTSPWPSATRSTPKCPGGSRACRGGRPRTQDQGRIPRLRLIFKKAFGGLCLRLRVPPHIPRRETYLATAPPPSHPLMPYPRGISPLKGSAELLTAPPRRRRRGVSAAAAALARGPRRSRIRTETIRFSRTDSTRSS